MNYILCSVLWQGDASSADCGISAIYAARIDNSAPDTAVTSVFENDPSCGSKEFIGKFLDFCGTEFMLCLWDGLSAGRMKKALDRCGRRHPYIHMYHLQKVFELSEEKCYKISDRRNMQNMLDRKPKGRSGRPSHAENELKWLISIFGLLDFSVMEKKPSIDFIDQPSNQYFVFKNGRCFHTNKCRIVKDAPVSALRSYTYYASVIDAGFTPCMKCKPQNKDEATSSAVRQYNAEKKQEAEKGKRTTKKHRKRKMTVYRSLSHMCSLYGLKYEKLGANVYITSKQGRYRIAPEEKQIILFEFKDNEYISTDKSFDDPYKAVREIVRIYEEYKNSPSAAAVK